MKQKSLLLITLNGLVYILIIHNSKTKGCTNCNAYLKYLPRIFTITLCNVRQKQLPVLVCRKLRNIQEIFTIVISYSDYTITIVLC